MSLEQVREALQDRNAEVVGERSGVHPNTVRAIKRGKLVVMSNVLERLSDYLEGKTDE